MALICLAAVCFFMAVAIALIPTLGVQQDEVLFAMPLYKSDGSEWTPMLMSYLGKLKTLLYSVIFPFWKPSVYSIRVPVVLIAAASIWLTAVLVRKWHGPVAALFTTLLLASDPIFLMTAVFDWGPVVLQHLLFVAMLLFGTRYCESNRIQDAIFAGVCGGLGLWDKALFGWLLAGLLVAIAVEWGKIKSRLRAGVIAAALAGFLAGVAPLIWYNLRAERNTITANLRQDTNTAALGEKLTALQETLDGSFLFHYMVRNDAASDADAPRSLMLWSLILAVPFAFAANADARLLLRFIATTAIVGWLCMFFTRGTGGSPHHIVLLWPLPQMFVGIVAAEMVRRTIVTTVVVAAVLLSQAFVVNEYYWRARHFGGTKYWTDAINALAEEVATSRSLITPDWGIENPVTVLSHGVATVRLVDVSSPSADWRGILGAPSVRILVHTPGNEIFPGVTDKLRRLLASSGQKTQVDKTVHDRNGRPIFEIWGPIAE